MSGSWFLTAHGYMLDWLGEVISTVSFYQLSGGVCYPTNLCINCRLCMDLCWTYEVCNYAWDQYTDSIVNPLAYVPVWCCVWICQV